MTYELPPASYSAKDRPPVITIDGCKIYVHIHDAEYMRERSAWRQRLAAAHPDRGGSPTDFRRTIVARLTWLKREYTWYARLGLTPPDGPAPQLSHATRILERQLRRPILAAQLAKEE